MFKNKKILSALLSTFVLFYLVSHAFSGERGLYVLLKEQRHLELLKAELDDVSKQRQQLEHRVQLISSNSLDLDLLDEQSRRYLGSAGKDEVMIQIPPQKKAN